MMLSKEKVQPPKQKVVVQQPQQQQQIQSKTISADRTQSRYDLLRKAADDLFLRQAKTNNYIDTKTQQLQALEKHVEHARLVVEGLQKTKARLEVVKEADEAALKTVQKNLEKLDEKYKEIANLFKELQSDKAKGALYESFAYGELEGCRKCAAALLMKEDELYAQRKLLQQDLDDAEKAVAELLQTHDHVTQQVRQHQEGIQAFDTKTAGILRTIASLDQLNESLKEKLNTLVGEQSTIEVELSKEQHELQHITSEQCSASQQSIEESNKHDEHIRTMIQTRDSLLSDIIGIKSEIAQKENMIEELSSLIEQKETTLASLADRSHICQLENEETLKRTQELVEELQTKKRSLGDIESALDRRNAELATVDKDLQESSRVLQGAREKTEQLLLSLEKLKLENRQFQASKLDLAKAQFEKLRQQYDATTQKLSHERFNTDKMVSDRNEACKARYTEVTQTKNAISALTAEATAAQEKYDATQQRKLVLAEDLQKAKDAYAAILEAIREGTDTTVDDSNSEVSAALARLAEAKNKQAAELAEVQRLQTLKEAESEKVNSSLARVGQEGILFEIASKERMDKMKRQLDLDLQALVERRKDEITKELELKRTAVAAKRKETAEARQEAKARCERTHRPTIEKLEEELRSIRTRLNSTTPCPTPRRDLLSSGTTSPSTPVNMPPQLPTSTSKGAAALVAKGTTTVCKSSNKVAAVTQDSDKSNTSSSSSGYSRSTRLSQEDATGTSSQESNSGKQSNNNNNNKKKRTLSPVATSAKEASAPTPTQASTKNKSASSAKRTRQSKANKAREVVSAEDLFAEDL